MINAARRVYSLRAAFFRSASKKYLDLIADHYGYMFKNKTLRQFMIGNVDLNALIKEHKDSGKTVTITAIQPQGRFGVVDFDDENTITSFNEKGRSKYINAGFMVAEPELFD